MPTIPTDRMERELRKAYLQWLGGLSKHEDDLQDYIRVFEGTSRGIITKLGGAIAYQGAIADFPAPKLLTLSPYAGKVYDQMQQAAIQASIQAGLNSRDAARQLLHAGLDKNYRKLERLARTETTSAFWKNSWDSIADLPLIVMVWGSEQSKKTCDYCLSRNGLVIEDGNIRDHPNGRCTPIPTLRSQVKYIGTLQPDGSVTMDPAWGKPVGKPVPLPAESKPTPEQADPLSGKQNPVAPSVANPEQAVKPGISDQDKIKNAEKMFGTGSPQHKAAQKRFSKPTTKPPTTVEVPKTNPRIIKTDKDMDDFAKGMPKPSSLSPKAAQVLDDYAKGTAYTSNAVLRGQKTYMGRAIDARTKDYTKKFVKDMDKMMDNSIIPEDVRVVRAVQADAFGGIENLKNLVGGIYQDKGYMSTSLAEKVSSKVYNVKDAVEMEITAPKGTRGIYMAGDSYLKSERELLLDRNTNLAVQSATYDEKAKKWLIKAIVVPGPR